MISSRNKPVVLEAFGLSRSFDDEPPVFEDVNLTLHEGEFVSILGLSGAGKSTLFNILAGLDQPDRGTVTVSKKVGYMLQKDLLLPWKRLIDNIALPLVLQGMSRKEAQEKARPYLPQFGLSGLERRFPTEVSGGQRQRAALLRTYLYGGELLLLDEPFAGIDAITRKELQAWLKTMQAELGLTILLISHDLDEALALSDQVYVLSAGQPAALQPPLEVASQPAGSLLPQLLDMLYTTRDGIHLGRKKHHDEKR